MSFRHVAVAAGALLVGLLGTGATLAYFEETLPTTMNPLYTDSMVDYRSQELVFDRLWYHDPNDNSLRSRVVDDAELVDAGMGLEITLKPEVRWHDLQPLTAEDICFTVDAMLDPNTPSVVAQKYREVLSGCEVKNKQIAVLKFVQVFHNPKERLGFHILPKAAFSSTAIMPDMSFSSRPIGTGAMKGSRGSQKVVFDAFPNAHHNSGIAQLLQQQGGDPQVQVTTIINDGVQGIVAVPPNRRPTLRASDDVSLKSYDLRSWWFVAVNTNSPFLADKRVRQGLNLSIDRNELRRLAVGWSPGQKESPCELISGPFIKSSPYYNQAIPDTPTADLARAEALFGEAGLTKISGRWHQGEAPVTLRIGMLGSLDNEAPDILDQIGNQLADAGFDRRVQKISSDEWSAKVKTGKASDDFDLLIGKWSFGLNEDVSHLFHTRDAGEGTLNLFGYANPEVDALLEEFTKAYYDTAARDAYHQLHSMLSDDLPYLFLWKLDARSAWRREVKGNVITPYYYFTEFDRWTYSK